MRALMARTEEGGASGIHRGTEMWGGSGGHRGTEMGQNSTSLGPVMGLVLEQTSWSLARLQVQPPQEWSDLFLDLAFDAMPGMR